MRAALVFLSFICVALVSDTKAAEIEKPLASWSQTVIKIGREYPIENFNIFAHADGNPLQIASEKDQLRFIALRLEGTDFHKIFVVRKHANPQQMDIVLLVGIPKDTMAYLTNESGRLRYAARWREKTGFVPIPARKARKEFTRLRQNWPDFEAYYNSIKASNGAGA